MSAEGESGSDIRESLRQKDSAVFLHDAKVLCLLILFIRSGDFLWTFFLYGDESKSEFARTLTTAYNPGMCRPALPVILGFRAFSKSKEK